MSNSANKYSKELLEYTQIGAEALRLLESVSEKNRREFIQEVLLIFPLLYVKARLLSKVALEDELIEDELPHFISEEDYQTIYFQIAECMGQYDVFLSAEENDMRYSELPVAHSIGEYLADCYQAVGDFLGVVRDALPEYAPYAAARCLRDFHEYWGEHLLEALTALHRIPLENNEDDNLTSSF